MEDIEAARKPDAPRVLPHRHDFFTILVVEQASAGFHQIDFRHYDLTPNTIYFVAPEQIHHLEAPPNAPVKGHAIMFTADFLLQHSLPPQQLAGLELFFNCDESKPLMLEAADIAALGVYFQHLDREFSSSQPDRFETLGAWLKLLLLECKRLKSARQVQNIKMEHRQAAIIRKFKEDVEQHFVRWHQVAEYAQAQNLTSNYLNEIIKSVTGVSAKDFILNRIVLEAKRLARYSEMSAKEVAFALGYEDVAHFSKFFKKSVGLNFSEFKEQQ